MNADLDAATKAYTTLRARFALRGYTLRRTDPSEGAPRYFVSRWGLLRELANLDEVTAFAEQVGA